MMSGFSVFSPLLRRSVPWTCRGCLQRQALPQQRTAFATKPPRPTNPTSKTKRKRGLIIASGGLVTAGTLVTVSDDAKHGVTAVKRSGRVVSTLFININEYAYPQLLYI
jgi:aarF domain-containing kinase